MSFVPDKRFASLGDAFEFMLSQHAVRPSDRLWLETESGLVVPQDAPRYLFRGECGEFETTKAGIRRPNTYRLKDGRRLSPTDLHALQVLIPELAGRFSETDYALD